MSQLSTLLPAGDRGVPLCDLAAELARRITADDVPAGTGRRYARLAESPTYEAWLIVWPSGTGLGQHDHDGSEAGVALVSGRLRERYRLAGGLFTRWLEAGGAWSLPHDHVHEVLNLDAADAVSVHVYVPKMQAMRFHDEDHEIDLTASGRR